MINLLQLAAVMSDCVSTKAPLRLYNYALRKS